MSLAEIIRIRMSSFGFGLARVGRANSIKKARESLQTPWRQLIVKLNYFLFMDLFGFLDSPLLIPAKMASEAGIFQGDHSSRIF
jgi:hypothetical protein